MTAETVGILGYGEIGQAMAKICQESNFKVLIRELKYDQIGKNKIDYLHVNIPEISPQSFIEIVTKNIRELMPALTIINSSISPGVTRKIYNQTHANIVHSPVIGLHPNLYLSIKKTFTKVIGPIDRKSQKLATRHFKHLKLKVSVYDSPENSETAKLLDLVYYAWNIIFCKWVNEICQSKNLNFDQAYTLQNKIYNSGYSQLLPNVVRPVLTPVPGPIGGHCTIPDTVMFHKYLKNRFTNFILNENKRYHQTENVDIEKERARLHKARQ